VHALQFLDVINMKDSTQKAHFYRNTLKDVLPYIPKVSDFISLWTFIGAKNVAQEKEQVTFSDCFLKYYVAEERKIVVLEGSVPPLKSGHAPTHPTCP
jgi:hypothetical protein